MKTILKTESKVTIYMLSVLDQIASDRVLSFLSSRDINQR